jgi:soluble lytic murein transglycosylase-like protein
MTPYDSIFRAAAAKYSVPQAVIEAVARTESSLNSSAIGDNGESVGLFQMYRPTARRYGVTDLHQLLDPIYATDRATAYMADIIANQGGLNLPDFYSEYNSGKKSLWQTSSEVYDHVQTFLRNYALSVSPSDVAGIGVLTIGMALFTLWYFKRHR